MYWLVAALIGIGATLVVDLWTVLLKRVFRVPSLSYCLVGRWICSMPGKFAHASISSAAPKRYECPVGWLAHYAIGIIFAVLFLQLAPESWLMRPTPWPALAFGIGTVLFPYLLMQPAFGLGFAASKAPKPAQARLKSLATHAVFGIGLYASAVGVACLLRSGT